MVLLSVDPGYFGENRTYVSQAEKILKRNKIDWPSVFLPGGCEATARTPSTCSGTAWYWWTPTGIVRSINPRGEELEAAVERVLREEKPH